MTAILEVPTFRCGHPKVAGNMISAGNGKFHCKTCKYARERAYKEQYPERVLAKYTRHNRKRGALPGHRNARKTTCAKGHPFNDENTYEYRGTRQCKTCRRAECLEYHHNKRGNGGTHTDEQWVELCAMYDHKCLGCGEVRPLTRDHVVPVVCGGTNNISNIQPLCKPCNSAKGKRMTDYRKVVCPT